SDFIYILLYALAVINYLFALFVVFFERKNPGTIWAWLLVFALVPCFPFVIYLIFGFEGRKDRLFTKKRCEDEEILNDYLDMNPSVIADQIGLTSKKNIIDGHHTEYLNDVVLLSIFASQSPYTHNNSVTAFHDGMSKFEALFEDIKNAKKFIHLEYYIFNDDVLGNKIISMLCEKLKEGIEVKLLTDGIGNFPPGRKLVKPLIDCGGEFAYFLSPIFFRINNRDHRKIAIIDGNIGYIGGINIGDEYIGNSKKFGYWRDSHIKVEGDSVHFMEVRFISDWNFCTKNKKMKIEEKYFPPVPRINNGIPIQIISSGADSVFDGIHQSYFKMITEANESIYIETPYFVPDDSILQALKIASLSGHDVKIIIPYRPDHIIVKPASLSYIGELLDAGVRCYLYKSGFIHSKVITMDSMITSVGSANMDIRSFKLNFEVNAFIYDRKITEEFNRAFERDLLNCVELTPAEYMRMGRTERMKEALCRLISPML
ncbi:MAG: cardiolipin synthase, partial [Firmicutes bacterium]|nr:cardiolipin synthase [Bacillota bacterium]